LGPFMHVCAHCHTLHWLAEKMHKSSAENPVFTECCNNDKIEVPFLNMLPPEMALFFSRIHEEACEFKKNICLYNKALAFTSTG
ncbi:hypothetical protein EI94DRAFT_1544149, partial [Lactarius quietus]